MPERAPTFSVVMPTCDSEAFVEEAVQSVIQQTLDSWELLIIDDASKDETPNILVGLARHDSRIELSFNDRNEGPAKARNRAISIARGRYIAFLDSDDVWRHDKLERQLGLFEATGTPLAFSGYEKIDERGRRLGRIVTVPGSVSYRRLLGETLIATCTAAYDSHSVGKILMPDIRKRQDFGLWLKILRNGGVARAIDEPLAYLRKRNGSVSSNKLSAASYVWRVYRDLERLPFLPSAYYFLKYAYHAAIKARI